MPMIALTRLNGNPLLINADLIKYAESSPDTTLTLITGEKVVVRERPEEVLQQAFALRVRLLRETGLPPSPERTRFAAIAAAASATAAVSASAQDSKAGEPLRHKTMDQQV